MDLPEASTHSFVIKIWIEERDDKSGKVSYRGYITHVPSGARRYLKDLNDIINFILTYLEAMGVRPGPIVRVWRWLRRTSLFQRPRG